MGAGIVKAEPLWWEDAGAPTAPAEQNLPPEVDLVIVGAGLTGLSAARTAARGGRSVLCLDAGAPGIGASSRNGGMVGGGHRLSIETLQAMFGHDLATRVLREAHLDSHAFVRTLQREESIACDYVENGRFRGLWRDRDYDATGRALDRLKALIPLEAEMRPRARQHEDVATDLYRGGTIYLRHGGLNPAKWVAGLMGAARRAGALVQGHTPVLGVEGSGTAFEVRTTRGTVRGRDVLIATNGYTPACLPGLRRRVVPVPSFIVATEELGAETVRALFPTNRMIVETRDRHCYFRASPDGTRVVFGGRAAMFDIPEAVAQAQMRGLLLQVFPGLAGVRLSHSWRGRTGFSFNYLPNVGRIEGIWHALGYSGSGNAMAPWLGHKAALAILGDPEAETAFARTGLPTRPWYRGTPWFLPFADIALRAKDGWNAIRRDG